MEKLTEEPIFIRAVRPDGAVLYEAVINSSLYIRIDLHMPDEVLAQPGAIFQRRSADGSWVEERKN